MFEQPPVSIDESGESPTTVEPPTIIKQLKNGITIQGNRRVCL